MNLQSNIKLLTLFCCFSTAVFCQQTTTSQAVSVATELPEVTLAFRNVQQVTLDQVFDEAIRTNKPVFIDFYTTWCGPCKWMDKNVFSQEEVAIKLNENFINYKVDAEATGGVPSAQKYYVSAYPTLIFLTPKGEVLHRIEGMIPQQPFMQIVEEIMLENK